MRARSRTTRPRWPAWCPTCPRRSRWSGLARRECPRWWRWSTSRSPPERTSSGPLGEELRKAGVEWVCLAGFMRLLSADFLASFPGRVLNIHPALLPAFPGLHAQRQALERGVKIAGCTVHFVDAGTDTGPIIAQAAVPVLPGDDEESLSARILREEHRLYPLAVRLAVTGKVTMQGTRTQVDAAGHGERAEPAQPGSTAMTERTREERLAALREARVVLVSACLLGEACRYDGKSKGSDPVMRALEGKEVVPVCPETGAGLGIPRPAVELRGGTGEAVLAGRAQAVVAATGEDRTAAFRHGAELALAAARRFGAHGGGPQGAQPLLWHPGHARGRRGGARPRRDGRPAPLRGNHGPQRRGSLRPPYDAGTGWNTRQLKDSILGATKRAGERPVRARTRPTGTTGIPVRPAPAARAGRFSIPGEQRTR